MLRHLAASWLFAGFLVVVAVATWRVLDARTPSPPTPTATPGPSPAPPPAPFAPAIIALGELPVAPPVPVAPPPVVSSCGDAHDPFDASRGDLEALDAGGTSPIQIGTQPFAEMYLDGRRMGSTPFYGPRKLDIPLGRHEVEFQDKASGAWYRFRLDVKRSDPENKVIIVLGKDRPRVTGAVSMKALPAAMRDSDAQRLFSDAVDALRARESERGCTLLERVADGASRSSRWREKAEALYARRCD